MAEPSMDPPPAVTIGDGAVTYVWGARRRPFVHPLRTPGGVVLTRDAPDDHPWHHALWFTIKFVNGENFWEEYGDYGVLRHDGPPQRTGAGDGERLQGTLRWVRPDRRTVVLVEDRRLTYVRLADDAHAVDVETTLVPQVDVELDRTPFTTWGGYGGLTLRGRPDHTDTRLLLDDGSTHERVLGTPSTWCDLSGAVDGHPAGVLLVDHPANPRAPVPWYASTRADTYGDEGWSNFVNAAFLWDAPLSVAAGEPLTFRYRVVAHDGAWGRERCEEAAHRWWASVADPP